MLCQCPLEQVQVPDLPTSGEEATHRPSFHVRRRDLDCRTWKAKSAFLFAGAQFNIARFRLPHPSCPHHPIGSKKGPRLSHAVQVREETPGTGSDSGELSLTPVSQM
jgi:hypothetical protein